MIKQEETENQNNSGFYSNNKVKQRLEAFYRAKKQVSLKEVDVKVIFSVNPAKKIKKLLESIQQQSKPSPCLEEVIYKLTSPEEAWSEFGMDVFQEVWITSLVEFLRIVPKDSLLMKQLLSNETLCMLETQCSNSNNNQRLQKTTRKRNLPYIPTTNLGEKFTDIFSGDEKYQQVEKKIKAHINSQYYTNSEGSFVIPPYTITKTDEVWTTLSPVVIETPSGLNYKIKLISFHTIREEQKTMKCFMTTATPITNTQTKDSEFERIIFENRYKEVRYLYVDLSQCHVKISSPDLSCFISHLHKNTSYQSKEEESHLSFTSTNYIVATYIADYLGLSVFPRGWENAKLPN